MGEEGTLDACCEKCRGTKTSKEKLKIKRIQVRKSSGLIPWISTRKACRFYIVEVLFLAEVKQIKVNLHWTTGFFHTKPPVQQSTPHPDLRCRGEGDGHALGRGHNRIVVHSYDENRGRCIYYRYMATEEELSQLKMGRDNFFPSLNQCQKICQDELYRLCSAKPDLGDEAKVRPKKRFFYDPSDRSCKQFVYMGAGGNGNNFGSEKKCLAKCETIMGDNDIISKWAL